MSASQIHQRTPQPRNTAGSHKCNVATSVPATKTAALERLMRKQWVTCLDGALKVGIFSVGQRAGEFRKEGLKVIDKWISRNGSRFKAWRIVG